MKSGVYKILNLINGKCYIGSSENIKRRLKDHSVYLKNNKHPSTHLQNAYNKYGKVAFVFGVIEYCEIDKLEQLEESFLSKIPKNKQYNQRAISKSNRGMKWSEETKQKLKGRIPWNVGLKGVQKPTYSIPKGERISIRTEFKKGNAAWNKGTKGLVKPNKGSFQPKSFSVLSPSNMVYEGVNLSRFCKEFGLSYSIMQKIVFYKTRQEYNGWKLAS